MKIKRSQEKRISRTSQILRFMRMSKRISMRTAGAIGHCSASAISHYEQGRMDIPTERIGQLVQNYGFTMAEFDDYLSGKPIPVLSIKEECINLLDKIDETKLRAVHAVLASFTK